MSAHPRSFSGKLQQALRALQLEWHFSKAEILNLYLNLAPFGGTLIGVQAASISYFDKPLNQLTDAEAALLAVLPQAPSRWRPDRHPEAATFARNKVLKRMAQLKIWPQARVQDALQEPLFSLQPSTPLYAPLLARRLKKQCLDCEKIESLIVIEMQQQLEELVADYVSQLAPGLSIAMMVMENANGAVRSYIGSADFRDNSRFAHVDMVQAVRSPGSTLKPFLYALAIDRGLIHSQSLLQDTPRYKKAYRPLNFSGGFNGPVSVTQALQRSLNIPAVQVLE
jgi:penicillin-binding protein 1C